MFLLNILKIKPLTLTFRETSGKHWLLKQTENSFYFIKNMEYAYIPGAVLHLSHRGKITLSKLTML